MLPSSPSQLAALLTERAATVCEHLLPGGRIVGKEYHAADSGGGSGHSLKVVLEGDKAGVGADFATGETFGDLLDVWCLCRGVGLGQAMAEASSFLGIAIDGSKSRPDKAYQRPQRPVAVKRLSEDGKVLAYLKGRGLTEQALDDFRVAEQDGEWIVFPYLRDGVHVNTTYIHVERPDGKKQVRQEKGAEPCLFGWHALEKRFPTTRFVAITEGQIDAITLHQCGIPALSVPNGGGGGNKQEWVNNDYDRMSRFDTVYLCLDGDEPGQQATAEIAKRLGPERCRTVTLPHKDANECFKHGIRDFRAYLLSARAFDPAELKPAHTFAEAVVERFHPSKSAFRGLDTPWASLNALTTFRRGQYVLWTGFSGSGKSTLLSQTIVHGLLKGERYVWFSGEMPARMTLAWLVTQLLGEREPNPKKIRDTMMWLRDKLWIVDVVRNIDGKRLFELFRYAAKRYDIRNVVIDSLLRCGLREDDNDGQKGFVDLLCDFKLEYDAIVHLVAHQRKPDDEWSKPGKFGVRGASAITDEADIILSVWATPNEEQNEEPRPRRSKSLTVHQECDTILSLIKNRELGGKLPIRLPLYFEHNSLQFHEQQRKIVRYLDIESDRLTCEEF
jgi:twinkle protein